MGYSFCCVKCGAVFPNSYPLHCSAREHANLNTVACSKFHSFLSCMEKTPLVSGGEDAVSLLVETKALCYGAAKNNVTLKKKKKKSIRYLGTS